MTTDRDLAADVDERIDRIRQGVTAWIHGSPAATSAPIDPEHEVSVWLALGSAEREKVGKRLAVLVRHRREGGRGDVARVAEEIGTGRANVYRLIARMDSIGPVSGLVGQKRAQVPRSVIRDGFGQPVDSWLLTALEVNRDASAAEAMDVLEQLAREEGEDVKLPSASAVRRRMDHLRRELPPSEAQDLPLGARLLVDAGWLDMRVVEDREGTPAGQVKVIFAVDLSTGLICGHDEGISSDERLLLGLLSDLRMRVPELARFGVRVGDRLGSIRWVVPPSLRSAAELAGAYVPASRRPVLDLVARDVRRLDLDLVGVLGERVGQIAVRSRPSEGRRRGDAEGLTPIFHVGEAVVAVHREVELFNLKRLEELREAGLLLGNRARPANASRGEALQRDVVATFVSVSSPDEGFKQAIRRAYPAD